MSTPAEKINAPPFPGRLLAPKAQRRQRARRNWTRTARRAVVRYYAKHGSTATLKRFHISGSMLYRWRDENEVGKVIMKKKRGKGSAPGSGKSPVKAPASSRARAPSNVRDAIVYLEHAEAAARTTGKQWTDAELYALLALRTLKRGG